MSTGLEDGSGVSGLRAAGGLRLRSLHPGISGKRNVVEFQQSQANPDGDALALTFA
jgi:hypothetical protein